MHKLIRMRVCAAVMFASQFLAACDKADPPAPAPSSGNAADIAESAEGKIAILIKDVQTTNYMDGQPSQCEVTYNVFNNTKLHLFRASSQIADYNFDISDLSANSKFADDQILTVEPLNKSCSGVVSALISAANQVKTTTCTLENTTEGDCQSKIAGYVGLNNSFSSKIVQAEQVAAKEYQNEQAAKFEQAKAQVWAERGQYDVKNGVIFTPANDNMQLTIQAVLAPDFDPSKISEDTTISTSAVPFCNSESTVDSNASPRKLFVANQYRDEFGLTAWYKVWMLCSGEPKKLIWVSSQVINNMRQEQQLTLMQ